MVLAVRRRARWPCWSRSARGVSSRAVHPGVVIAATGWHQPARGDRDLAEKGIRGRDRQRAAGLTDRLKEGQSLLRRAAAFPHAFPELYVAHAARSQAHGSLSEALGRYVAYQTQLDGAKKHLVSAFDPSWVIVMIVGWAWSARSCWVTSRRVLLIYEDIGGDLPWSRGADGRVRSWRSGVASA